MKKMNRSNLRNGKCNVNVNNYNKKGRCTSSTQYKGIKSTFGGVTRVKKTGKTPKYRR